MKPTNISQAAGIVCGQVLLHGSKPLEVVYTHKDSDGVDVWVSCSHGEESRYESCFDCDEVELANEVASILGVPYNRQED